MRTTRQLVSILLVVIMTATSCAQDSKQTDKKENKILKDSIEPKVDYKVNKEYDENGNLIKYDSVYTYYYSNIDKNAMINDSVFKKFNKHFEEMNLLNKDPFLKDFFDKENFVEDDFFSEDFFRGNFDQNQEFIHKILSKMDSIKNQFFIKQFPLKEGKKDIDNKQ